MYTGGLTEAAQELNPTHFYVCKLTQLNWIQTGRFKGVSSSLQPTFFQQMQFVYSTMNCLCYIIIPLQYALSLNSLLIPVIPPPTTTTECQTFVVVDPGLDEVCQVLLSHHGKILKAKQHMQCWCHPCLIMCHLYSGMAPMLQMHHGDLG